MSLMVRSTILIAGSRLTFVETQRCFRSIRHGSQQGALNCILAGSFYVGWVISGLAGMKWL